MDNAKRSLRRRRLTGIERVKAAIRDGWGLAVAGALQGAQLGYHHAGLSGMVPGALIGALLIVLLFANL